jgi:putative hemolysin
MFAMVEMAVVSARRGALQQLAEAGVAGARTALRIAENPGSFLSTVQFGITVVGIFAGAYSGARFAGPLAALFPQISLAEELSFALVVAAVTYVSIVVGELVPKQLALRHAAIIAARAAAPMAWLSRWAYPVVALLDASARAGLRLLGQAPATAQSLTAEEVRRLIVESTHAGVFTPEEMQLLDRAMDLGDRSAGSLMTQRNDVLWLDALSPAEEQLELLRTSPAPAPAPLPGPGGGRAGRGGGARGPGPPHDGRQAGLERAAAAGHGGARIPLGPARAARAGRKSRPPGLRGGRVRRLHRAHHRLGHPARHGRRLAGGWRRSVAVLPTTSAELVDLLVDASLPVEEAERILGRDLGTDGSYHTLAGFVLDRLGRIPAPGDSFLWEDWSFEVAEMEDRRVARLRIRGKRERTGGEPMAG